MKKQIKVYLQYPWKFPDSPYYKYLIQNHSKEIEYLNAEKQKGVITNKRFFWFSNFLKRNIRRFTKILKLSIPNAHLSPKGDYNLIHCAHCLSKNKDKPWVADVESVWQFYVGNKTNSAKEKVEKLILNENCKKIIAWTKKTKEELIKEFPKLKNKFEVVYPALPLNVKKKKFGKRITLLFVGRYFYWKGGLHALEVMDRLTKKYSNVDAICISEFPKGIKKKYSKNKKIKIYELMPQKKVFEIYKKSDIFIYPGYSDSFGFAFLEAMSFGMPIITVDGDSRREIIEDGKTGFVINKPSNLNYLEIKSTNSKLINDMVDKASIIIENKLLSNSISKNCINEIKNGKFSIKERNEKLKRIYEEAIK